MRKNHRRVVGRHRQDGAHRKPRRRGPFADIAGIANPPARIAAAQAFIECAVAVGNPVAVAPEAAVDKGYPRRRQQAGWRPPGTTPSPPRAKCAEDCWRRSGRNPARRRAASRRRPDPLQPVRRDLQDRRARAMRRCWRAQADRPRWVASEAAGRRRRRRPRAGRFHWQAPARAPAHRASPHPRGHFPARSGSLRCCAGPKGRSAARSAPARSRTTKGLGLLCGPVLMDRVCRIDPARAQACPRRQARGSARCAHSPTSSNG